MKLCELVPSDSEQKFLSHCSLPGDKRDLLFSLMFLPHLSVLSLLAAGARRVFGSGALFSFTLSGRLFKPEVFQHYECTVGVGHTHTYLF